MKINFYLLFACYRMASIEEEMRKRRGQRSDSKNDDENEVTPKHSNPQDELFQAPDHLGVWMDAFKLLAAI